MALIGSIDIGMKVSTGELDKGLAKGSNSIVMFGSRTDRAIAGSMGSAEARIKAFGLNASDLAEGLGGETVPRVKTLGDALTKAGITGETALAALKTAALAAAAAIAAVGTTLLYHGFNSLKAADDTMDLADRLGTTAGNLRVLRYVAKLSGSEMGAMDAAVGRMSAKLGEASTKGTPAGQVLERIGLSAKKLAAMDPGLAIEEIIKNFDKLPDSAQQAAAAMDLFGRGGLGILGTLKIGKEGLAKFTAETGNMRTALSGVNGEQIAEANDAMDRMSFAWEGLGTMIAIQIAPLITDVMTSLTGWLKELSTDGSAAQVAFKGLADVLGLVAKGLKAASNLNPWKIYTDLMPKETIHLRPDKNAKKAEKPPKPDRKIPALDSELVEAIAKSREWEKTLSAQITTFGQSSDAVDLYKLKVAGVPPEIIKNVEGLVNLHAQMEANKKTWDAMRDDAKRFYEESMTPQQKAYEHYQKLNTLLEKGLITKQTYDQALRKDMTEKARSIIEQTRTPIEQYHQKVEELKEMLRFGVIDQATFDRAEKLIKPMEEKRFAGLALQGSQEAYSAIITAKGGQQNSLEPAKNTAKNTAETVQKLGALNETMAKWVNTAVAIYNMAG